MTVDSAYYPVVFANDGEVEYTVELESIGGVFQVYKVPDDGAARTLLTEDYHYTVAYEEHLDPIKKRAVITLAAPIASDAHLEVFRSTTIATDFAAEALKPFPSEQFEYTLDQICFIQQEIEGHLCACAGGTNPGTPTYPPVVVPPVPPECLPYDCEAFAQEAASQGMTVADFGFLGGPAPTMPADGIFPSVGGGLEGKIIDSWKGQLVPTNDASASFAAYTALENVEGDAPDWCSGIERRLVLASNPSSTTDNLPRLSFNPPYPAALTFIHRGSIGQRASGSGIFSVNIGYSYNRRGGGTGFPWQPVSGSTNRGAMMRNGDLRRIDSGGSTNFFPSIVWQAVNTTHIAVEFGAPYQELDAIYWASAWRDYYRIYVDITCTCRVNGTTVALTEKLNIGASFIEPATDVSVVKNYSVAFAAPVVHLFGVAWGPALPDVEALELAIARNYADYEIPGTCPVLQTEQESVSSTPPVQGIFD